LASTFRMLLVLPCAALNASFTATGASFTLVTVTVTVAVAVSPAASLMV